MNRIERNTLVTDNLPLVGHLVSEVCAGATHLSRDDLAQAGAEALIKAAEKYDPTRGVPFGAYARRIIRFGIQDEMRNTDWAKRTSRDQITAVRATQETLTRELGRAPSVEEIASALGVDKEAAIEFLSYATRTVTGLEGSAAEHMTSDVMLPEQSVTVAERVAYLRAGVESLPEKLRHVVTEVYFNNRTVQEIADELGVTHSAISQQRTEAIKMLRGGLETHYGDDDSNEPIDISKVATTTRRAEYLHAFADKITSGLTLNAVLQSA